MKITKQRLKEIIKEELNEVGLPTYEGEPFGEYDLEAENEKGRAASLADLQSDEKFTGGSPEERLLTLMKAREVLAAMSKEDLTALSKSLDAEQVAVLRHILANPMYAPMQEGSREDQELLNRLKQKYGRKAAHFTLEDIQDLHPSYKGNLRDIAQGLGIR
jgi:hypothetical protein